jgi:hypothetical protein
MKSYKFRVWAASLALCALGLIAAGGLTKSAVGTPASNSSRTLTMKTSGNVASEVRDCLVINNRTASAVFFKLNDSATTSSCSATSYDIVLDSNETEIFGRDTLRNFPITTVSCFNASTTPTVRIIGW